MGDTALAALLFAALGLLVVFPILVLMHCLASFRLRPAEKACWVAGMLVGGPLGTLAYCFLMPVGRAWRAAAGAMAVAAAVVIFLLFRNPGDAERRTAELQKTYVRSLGGASSPGIPPAEKERLMAELASLAPSDEALIRRVGAYLEDGKLDAVELREWRMLRASRSPR